MEWGVNTPIVSLRVTQNSMWCKLGVCQVKEMGKNTGAVHPPLSDPHYTNLVYRNSFAGDFSKLKNNRKIQNALFEWCDVFQNWLIMVNNPLWTYVNLKRWKETSLSISRIKGQKWFNRIYLTAILKHILMQKNWSHWF